MTERDDRPHADPTEPTMPRPLLSSHLRQRQPPPGRDPSIGTPVVVRLLAPGDEVLLDGADAALVDEGVDRRAIGRLLGDPRRHVAIALDGMRIVGIAFGAHQSRGRRMPEHVVGDVRVVPSHRRRGVGRRLLALLLGHGRAIGCALATVEAERDDAAMRRLCAGMGGVEQAEPVVRVAFPLA